MPTLDKPTLDLEIHRPQNTVDAVVTTKVGFNNVELNEIRQLGVRYRLGCRILEQDPGADELVHRFDSKTLPEGDPNQLGNELTVTFQKADLEMSKFDQDPAPLNRDEIYARVTLVNTTDADEVVSQDSDIIQAQFAA